MQDLIVSLFVTSDNAILIQDRFPKDLAYGRLLALEIPYFYFAKKVSYRIKHAFFVSRNILPFLN